MSEQTWTPSPEGSICWIEIPARDAEKLKVSSYCCYTFVVTMTEVLVGFLLRFLSIMGVQACQYVRRQQGVPIQLQAS
jgi:hypothetical protein